MVKIKAVKHKRCCSQFLLDLTTNLLSFVLAFYLNRFFFFFFLQHAPLRVQCQMQTSVSRVVDSQSRQLHHSGRGYWISGLAGQSASTQYEGVLVAQSLSTFRACKTMQQIVTLRKTSKSTTPFRRASPMQYTASSVACSSANAFNNLTTHDRRHYSDCSMEVSNHTTATLHRCHLRPQQTGATFSKLLRQIGGRFPGQFLTISEKTLMSLVSAQKKMSLNDA